MENIYVLLITIACVVALLACCVVNAVTGCTDHDEMQSKLVDVEKGETVTHKMFQSRRSLMSPPLMALFFVFIIALP